MNFQGTFEALQDRLLLLGIDGEWEEKPNGVWKLRREDRSGLLWSSTKGTIWFEGPAAAKAALQKQVAPNFTDASRG